MTVEDEGKEDAGNEERTPRLASLSTKGFLSSFKREGEESDGSLPGMALGHTPPGKAASRRSIFSAVQGTMYVSPMASMRDLTPLKTNINKFLTPSQTFARLREEKEELSRTTPSPAAHSYRDGFTLPLIGEVQPKALLSFVKIWLRNPKNIALIMWGLGVTVSGAILFMVMVGMLNAVIPKKSERNTWFEVSNQVINALFTLMCVYMHPRRCQHLYMLWRWRAEDIVRLRDIYCKHGARKPHEWGHMLVVVLLLHLNCFAQYALCGLNWGYRRAERPAIGVALCLCLSLGGAAAAGIYNTVSPLGKDFDMESDDDDEEQELQKVPHGSSLNKNEDEFVPRAKLYGMLEKHKSFACREEGGVVEKPVWRGGLFNIKKDPSVSVLSTLCCVCVFGWNMDRMGFGNRYVHIITFCLICTAPFWIFDLAALNIQNRYVRHAIGGTGIALCAFGLLYGGYWRIRMRERYKLPANRFCCGKASVTDCFQWLFCPLCSLCQETRTAEYYDVKDAKFYARSSRNGNGVSPAPVVGTPRTPAPTLSGIREMPGSLERKKSSMEGENRNGKNPMEPPTPVAMSTLDTNLMSPGASPSRNETSAVLESEAPTAVPHDSVPPAVNGEADHSAQTPSHPPQFSEPEVLSPGPGASDPLLPDAEKVEGEGIHTRTAT